MTQDKLLEIQPKSVFFGKSPEEIESIVHAKDKNIKSLERKVTYLEEVIFNLRQSQFFSDEQLHLLRNKIYGSSSEKSSTEQEKYDRETVNKPQKAKKDRILLPSERYPNAPIIERDIELAVAPLCPCCNAQMKDSGLTEDSEYLTVIPATYMVVRQKRHTYNCGKCYGAMITAANAPRIKPGSAYSDEMMIDVSLSKYCDLIPVQRYVAIAERAGFKGIPSQSLIESTHYVAQFVKRVYDLLKTEILNARVLHADETPHRMLEGSDKKSWHLWGFSSKTTAYFEVHDTRSGDVASELLKNSLCEFLISDVYSGYAKTVRLTNEHRKALNSKEICNIYCNAHARRKFKEASEKYPDEAKFFVDGYKEIYHLEPDWRNLEKPPDKAEVLEVRKKMQPIFEKMRVKIIELMPGFSDKSTIAVAMRYFLKNYKELTQFIENAELPIDNNQQERLLRNPVIGRKTWYGTHSEQGAETNAILFSLIESCKLNKVNPREYFRILVQKLHVGEAPFTPKDFFAHLTP